MRPILFFLFSALLLAVRSAVQGESIEMLFTDNPGLRPSGNLVRTTDGSHYGTTFAGGASNWGTVFRITPDGEITTIVSFNLENGAGPTAGLAYGNDGNFYGTTRDGGANKRGTAFRVTPDGVLTTLVTFGSDNGTSPDTALTLGSDGNFYGTTSSGGVTNHGTVFKMTPAGVLTTIASFTNSAQFVVGASPLIEDVAGVFYGTTMSGGTNVKGSIFKVTSSGELTTLFSFNGENGSYPKAGLVKGTDGNFYGTTSEGGTTGGGTVFRVSSTGELTTIASFGSPNGIGPAALTAGSDGNLYGTTFAGGTNSNGTLFKLSPSGELTTLLSFNVANGAWPETPLLEAPDGSFYGTTKEGGSGSRGTAFKIKPSGEFTSIASFSYKRGVHPSPGLVEGIDGNFYGVTEEGGPGNFGTIFKVTPGGSITTIASFDGANGSRPAAKLTLGDDGNFYGTTVEGGVDDLGTVFRVTPGGELSSLASFNHLNGRSPRTGLVKGNDGNFYGTTPLGGTNGLGRVDTGTVFKITSAGELTTLFTFEILTSNGYHPDSPLLLSGDGNFYGTTLYGGTHNFGTVFKITPQGELTTLGSLPGSDGFSYPSGNLVEGIDGILYGISERWIFKVMQEGWLSSVARVVTNSNSGIIVGGDGNFYGTTYFGGAHGYGSIFRATPFGEVTTLYSFDGLVAAHPKCTPAFDAEGRLYGTADQMTVWRMYVPMVPGVAIAAPSDVTKTSAILPGKVNANGESTSLTIEYGRTPALGNSATVNPGNVEGRGNIAVSATLTGLEKSTTYYYRLTATNVNGTNSTAIQSFATVANEPPVAAQDSFRSEISSSGKISLPVLQNDVDSDGDNLTITEAFPGSFGDVTTDGSTVTYTPRIGFRGYDSFSYVISDGYDTAVAIVELQVTSPVTQVLLSKGAQVPGAGLPESGIPAGSAFKSFGTPAINSAGNVAALASYAAPKMVGAQAVIFVEVEARTFNSTIAARRGETAPGTEGAVFTAFKDPLLNEAGDVAFLASLSGGDTNKANNKGIWISSAPELEVGNRAIQMVARTGAQPPGVTDGAKWKSFTSVALSNGTTEEDSAAQNLWSIAFSASMATGPGGVKASNDTGLWIANSTNTWLALREGQKLQVGGTERELKVIGALKPLPGAQGQGNGITSLGAVTVQAFFKDGTQALLRVKIDEAGAATDNVSVETLAAPGDAVDGIAESAMKFGLPTQGANGSATAWIGSLSGNADTAAVFEYNQGTPGSLKLLARKGYDAPGIDGGTFNSFQSVAISDTGSAVLLGKVKGRGINSATDDALWWKNAGDEQPTFQLLAREGGPVPGLADGVRWGAFTSVALPTGNLGPLFTARLRLGGKGKITAANDQGLWAVDSTGALRLIVRERQEVRVEGSETPKVLKSFTVLGASAGSPAQRRSFEGTGQIAYQALFTDGTQSIVIVQVP